MGEPTKGRTSHQRARLVEEMPTMYVLHDGTAQFRVPKAGLSDKMHAQIKALSPVVSDEPRGYTPPPPLDPAKLAAIGPITPREVRTYSRTDEHGRPMIAPARSAQVFTDEAGRDLADVPPVMIQPTMADRARAVLAQVPEALGLADGGTVDPMALPQRVDAGPVPVTMQGQPQRFYRTDEMAQNEGIPQSQVDEMRARIGDTPWDRASGMASDVAGAAIRMDPGVIGTGARTLESLDQQKAAKQSIEVPGVVPAGTMRPSAETPPAAAVVPKKAPVGGGAGSSSTSDLDAYAGREQDAAEREYQAKSLQAQAVAKATADGVELQQQLFAKQRADTQRAIMGAQAQLTKQGELNEEMRRIDTSVDPGRFWASRTTGQKIAGIIGLALGSIGAGNDGVNRAAGLLNQAIDRDLEAQKAEHDLRLRKGQAAMAGMQSIHAANHQLFQDKLALDLADQVTARELTNSRIEMQKQATNDPVAKAQLEQFQSNIGMKLQADRAALKDRLADVELKRSQAAENYAQAGAAAAKTGLSPKQSDIVTEIESYNKNVQKNGQNLLALIDKYGTVEEMEPGVENRMRQLVDDMATDVAKMKDPGSAARPSEVELEVSNIFEPGLFQRDASAIASIKSYLANAEQRRKVAYEARKLRPPGE